MSRGRERTDPTHASEERNLSEIARLQVRPVQCLRCRRAARQLDFLRLGWSTCGHDASRNRQANVSLAGLGVFAHILQLHAVVRCRQVLIERVRIEDSAGWTLHLHDFQQ